MGTFRAIVAAPILGALSVAVLLAAVVLADEPASRAKPSGPAASRTTAPSDSTKRDKRSVSVYVFDSHGKLVGPIESPKLVLSSAQWRRRLTPEQYHVLRAKDTEVAFCGDLLDNKKEGVYTCAGCGLPLFASSAKFESGTGWPSFMQPVAEGNIETHRDHSDGTLRTETKCVRCKGHLGHVFDDGPQPTGLRYCLNSASLTFTEKKDLAKLADPDAHAPVDSAAESSGEKRQR